MTKDASRAEQEPEQEWIAEPVAELYVALDHFEPKAGRVVWVQLSPGDWIEGQILEFSSGAMHIEVRSQIASPPW